MPALLLRVVKHSDNWVYEHKRLQFLAVAQPVLHEHLVRLVQMIAEFIQILQGLVQGQFTRIMLAACVGRTGQRDQMLCFLHRTNGVHGKTAIIYGAPGTDKYRSENLIRLA